MRAGRRIARPLPRDPWGIRSRAIAARAFPGLAAPDLGAGGHDAYFAGLEGALKRAGIASPILVVDLDRYRANIDRTTQALSRSPSPLELRIVAKSLQAPALLTLAMDRARTDRLMVFNGVNLEEIADAYPEADVLLGRPLPAPQVAAFVARHVGDGRPAVRPAWLVDSERRLDQYAEIAREHGETLRMALEVDVGLHRGGVAGEGLARLIDRALAEPKVRIAGLMGYDAHAAGAPDPAAEAAQVEARYAAARAMLARKLGHDVGDLILNTAGSPTFLLHTKDKAANEVSVGSALVKPANFDLPLLRDYLPACFIASPVLKVTEPGLIPRLERHASDFAAIDPNTARGVFLFGGYGDGKPVSPKGLAFSSLYGGRAMLCGSAGVRIEEDDFVFLRPRESEGAFLQYGDIAGYEHGEIAQRWSTFTVTA